MARRGLYKPAATEEERIKRNQYMQDYKRRHPEKVKQWEENYIMRKAAKLQTAQADSEAQQRATGDGPGEGGQAITPDG